MTAVLEAEVKVDDSAVLATFDTIVERVRDMRPVWRGYQKQWIRRQRRVFTTTGGLAPLSPETIRLKRGNRIPLVSSGKLRAATYGQVLEDRRQAVFGVPRGNPSRGIGVTHARGTSRMPSRDPVPGLTPTERKDIRQRIRDHLLMGTAFDGT